MRAGARCEVNFDDRLTIDSCEHCQLPKDDCASVCLLSGGSVYLVVWLSSFQHNIYKLCIKLCILFSDVKLLVIIDSLQIMNAKTTEYALTLAYECACVDGYEVCLYELDTDECSKFVPCANGATCIYMINDCRFIHFKYIIHEVRYIIWSSTLFVVDFLGELCLLVSICVDNWLTLT